MPNNPEIFPVLYDIQEFKVLGCLATRETTCLNKLHYTTQQVLICGKSRLWAITKTL